MIEKYSYKGDSNIGFYATVTGDKILAAPDFDSSHFPSKSVETFIARTRLVGLYTAGNSNCIIVPRNLSEHESGKINDSEINIRVLETRRNALGNMILANDKGAVISPRIKEKKPEIEQSLKVEAVVSEVAGLPNPGVCGVCNNRGAVLHREANEKEAEKVKQALDLERIDIGSINLGSPYMGAGALATDERILVGENTSGPEIGRLDQVMLEHE